MNLVILQSETNVQVAATTLAPALIAKAGTAACNRFYEFFAANIRNKNTCLAYPLSWVMSRKSHGTLV